jgi:hypothetical protein
MSQVVVRCILPTLPFERDEAYYAEAVKVGDTVEYRVSAGDGEDQQSLTFNEGSFKKHFLTLQHRTSMGGRTYGGFRVESSEVVRRLLGRPSSK